MADPYIGEIRLFAGTFAPVGWEFCDGRTVSIPEYEPLFVLIGTTHGGDGTETFNLPDLRSRIPVGQGSGPGLAQSFLGQASGSEQVTLTANQMPQHTHSAQGSSAAAMSANPEQGVWAARAGTPYSAAAPSAALNATAVSVNGGGEPHDNVPPFLAVNFIIATSGIFPSRD